jgi:hypothetical protein
LCGFSRARVELGCQETVRQRGREAPSSASDAERRAKRRTRKSRNLRRDRVRSLALSILSREGSLPAWAETQRSLGGAGVRCAQRIEPGPKGAHLTKKHIRVFTVFWQTWKTAYRPTCGYTRKAEASLKLTFLII